MTLYVLLIAMVFGFRIDATTYEVPANIVSECNDLPIAFIDSDSWTIYGDQDMNGRIEGNECNDR